MGYYEASTYDISQYARTAESIDPSIAIGIDPIFEAIAGIYLIVSLTIVILQVVAMWKIFTKAGEKGWKSIIPIYNIVILFKISGLSPWLIFVYFAAIIPFIGWIAIFALSVYQTNSLAKSFGKDIGYTFGLLLLPTIFYMILGLGKSEYIGPGGKETVIETETVE